MATLSNDKTYVTVEKGDTLSEIARDFGNGKTYKQLAALNGIPNPDLIYIGQTIKLTSSGSTTRSEQWTRPSIKQFGLQTDVDNSLFVTWDWGKDNTDHYKVQWQYYTADGVWFVGNDSTTNYKYSIYSIPSNAKRVRVKVTAISKTYKKNNKDVRYWYSSWTTWKEHKVVVGPGDPPVPTVTLEGLDLKAEVSNLSNNPSIIQFEVVKDDSTVFKTIKSKVSTGSASMSTPVKSGSKYKVRCRAYKDGVYSDWSNYSANKDTIPNTPTGFIKCEPKTEKSIYLEWASISNATSYDIEYTTKKSNFDGSDQVQSKTGLTTTTYELSSGVESGQEYFFRIRAVNANGQSGWSEVSSTIIGGRPAAPTTWSSTNTVITGEPLNLYWVHNATDGSNETYAYLEIYIDGEKIVGTDIEKSTKEDEKDKTSTYSVKMVDDNGKPLYPEGAKLEWCVKTAGISKVYGDMSIKRVVYIYAPPTLELTVTNLEGNTFETLESFPFDISAIAGPSTQRPIGYFVSITANESYETVDDIGNEKTVSEGDIVYSKYFDISESLSTTISAGDVDLENGVTYTLTCTVSMDSALEAESSVEFTVEWVDIEYGSNAEISIDTETYAAYITPYCETSYSVYYKVIKTKNTYTVTSESIDYVYGEIVEGAYTTTGKEVYYGTTWEGESVYYCMVEETTNVDDVLLSVYRRDFDGNFIEIAKDLEGSKRTTVVDPHPCLDYARYRIVAKSKATGAISYNDIPGYYIGGKAVIIQWDEEWQDFNFSGDHVYENVVNNEVVSTVTGGILEQQPHEGSMLKLTYNVDVSDKYSSDVELIEYIGRKHPVSYYGTHRGETSTWNVVIPKSDEETIYALRRLANWMGDVYVREPSGSGYWANVNVSFSQKHCEVTIPVTIDIVRVEGGV